jgi:hypothetical protein
MNTQRFPLEGIAKEAPGTVCGVDNLTPPPTEAESAAYDRCYEGGASPEDREIAETLDARLDTARADAATEYVVEVDEGRSICLIPGKYDSDITLAAKVGDWIDASRHFDSDRKNLIITKSTKGLVVLTNLETPEVETPDHGGSGYGRNVGDDW